MCVFLSLNNSTNMSHKCIHKINDRKITMIKKIFIIDIILNNVHAHSIHVLCVLMFIEVLETL